MRAAAILIVAAALSPQASASDRIRAEQPASSRFVGALGRTSRVGRLSIRPTAVVEDSRCPANVQCIQAGTVRLRATVAGPGVRRSVTVGLGSAAALDGRWLHLTAVCPPRVASVPVARSAYRFHFVLSRSASHAPADRNCG